VAGASFVFDAELSARQNIAVIADEAHRSQYGFGSKVNEKAGEMSYGFASNLRDALPNASFIGLTGTPIEKTDANTRAVFGELDSQPGPFYELIDVAQQGEGWLDWFFRVGRSDVHCPRGFSLLRREEAGGCGGDREFPSAAPRDDRWRRAAGPRC